nr:MAG: hypothetical protein DIU57_17050 [Pseudomonadota bacterium]
MRTVFLKADDLRLETITKKWRRFLDYCRKEGVYCNVGVIAGGAIGLDDAQIEEIRYELHCLEMGKLWLLWNHGVWHKRNRVTKTSDFCGAPLEDQVGSLRLAQELVERIAGVRMMAFGAPFNWWDHNTVLALQQFPEIQYVFHIPYVPGKCCYGSEIFVQAEPFLGEVKPGAMRTFALETAKRKSERFLSIDRSFVLQIHPGSWDQSGFDSFAAFVDYIRNAGYAFASIADPCAHSRESQRTVII